MGFVFVRNMGGIGNQLFIYNFATLVSINCNQPLFVDNYTGFIMDKYQREPKLKNLLNFKPREATVFQKVLFYLLKRTPIRILDLLQIQLIIESNPSEMLDLEFIFQKKRKFYFIQGYFQSNNYVQLNKINFLNQISTNVYFDNRYEVYKKKILNTDSICVHVRRSSYDNYIPIEYYNSAMDKLRGCFENPIFYIFSDSLDWCKSNFNNSNCIFIEVNNSPDDIQELFLMSKCNHFIIANSTFSWWAAILGMNPRKSVIAPALNHVGVIDSFYPNDWIRL